MKINNIDKKEVIRYLGIKGEVEGLDLICKCMEECRELVDYRVAYREYTIEENEVGLEIKDTNKNLLGISIKKYLKGCYKVILIGVTLGYEVEKAIKRYEKVDLLKALVLDACSTAAIEGVCDEIENSIDEKVKANKEFTRGRFSPGYGDFPIEFQKDFLELVDASRTIGLNVTESNILIPRKSVTAIIGVSKFKNNKNIRSCEQCGFYNKCNYRKGGKKCYD